MYKATAFLTVVFCAGIARGQTAHIFYDSFEDGRLVGGRLVVDLSDPVQREEFGADLPEAFRPVLWPVTTVRNNGPSANRIDIVVLGDGYTSAEMTTYAGHANNVVNPFFAQEPLNAYAKYFNVHRVDVTSAQSGVDEIDQGIFKNTALDMEYGCFGIDRLLCVNVAKAYAAAASAPAIDQVLTLANSTRYGGAGYPGDDLGTLAGNNGSSIEVALHEFGHSFADLADEYDYADGATYFGPEFIETNVSIRNATTIQATQTKWFRWLDLGIVDAFEGGAYNQFGVFRPTADSKMRNLNRPFQPVNVEQFVMFIYQTVSPVDDASPTSVDPLGPCQPLFVTPLRPVGHSLVIQWLVNGSPVLGASGETFVPANGPLVNGMNTVSVNVVDPTTRVRDEAFRTSFMTFSRSWTVQALGPGCTCSAAVRVEPAAVAKSRYLSFDPSAIPPDSAIRVRLSSLMHPVPPDLPGTVTPDYSAIEGQVRWVGPPQLVMEDGGVGDEFMTASLQCQPHYQDWGGITLLHVSGAEVAPSSSYSIQAIRGGCDVSDEFSYAASLEIETGRWGDVVEPYQDTGASLPNQPDILDVAHIVDKLKAVPAAMIRARMQLQPASIDVQAGITVVDVGRAVDALKGSAYPFEAPPPCLP